VTQFAAAATNHSTLSSDEMNTPLAQGCHFTDS